ncbi:unnamed protein product [Adineta ricciae]|uniref:Uncharacterized protein n=1 Tax=Adineta ricciae TaxID=249248 RepID=A0A815GYD4_ADIRI|nr:unnamed protein product [Adineta ricciae]
MLTMKYLILSSMIFINTVLSNPITNYTQSHRGCGPFGIDIDTLLAKEGVGSITPCCVQHDQCYSTCGTTRDMCNNDFKNCTTTACKTQQTSSSSKCLNYANILYRITSVLGIPSFDISQAVACNQTSQLG